MTIEAKFEYDLDPRYGWVHVMAYGSPSVDFVIQTESGVYGYTFKDGVFIPKCVCSARSSGECCCQTGDWDESTADT